MNTLDINKTAVAAGRPRFSKQELFEELSWFMPALALGTERMFGTGAAILMRSHDADPYRPDLQALQETPLWRGLGELYDYGVHGVLPAGAVLADGRLADVESFVSGLSGLASYFAEDEGAVPQLAQMTVRLAQARQILDGGELYADTDSHRPAHHLQLSELALLANMEERAMMSAPSAQSPAIPETLSLHGATYVHVDEAKRWLSDCSAFVPTGTGQLQPFHFAKSLDVSLPTDVLRALNDRAAACGKTPFQLLRSVFADELARDCA